jgi:hypothetical protein
VKFANGEAPCSTKEDAREPIDCGRALFSKELIRAIICATALPVIEWLASDSDATDAFSNLPELLGNILPRSDTGPPRLARTRGDGGRGDEARSIPAILLHWSPGDGEAGLDTAGEGEGCGAGEGGRDHSDEDLDVGPPRDE